jgi:hypothetical protein
VMVEAVTVGVGVPGASGRGVARCELPIPRPMYPQGAAVYAPAHVLVRLRAVLPNLCAVPAVRRVRSLGHVGRGGGLRGRCAIGMAGCAASALSVHPALAGLVS